MILGLDGHLGDRVSALVDGQLTPAEEERAWAHAMTCAGCRRLIEREGWLKTRLQGLASPLAGHTGSGADPRPDLLGSLYAVDAWAAVDAIERHGRSRRIALAAAGAGSVGAAVLGLVAFTTPPAGRGEPPPTRPAPASVANPAGVGATASVVAGLPSGPWERRAE